MSDILQEFREEAQQAQQALEAELQRIEQNRDWSDEAKARKRREAQEQYAEIVQHIQAEARNAIEAQRRKLSDKRLRLRENEITEFRKALGDEVVAHVLLRSWERQSPQKLLRIYENGSEYERALMRLSADWLLDILDDKDMDTHRLRERLKARSAEEEALNAQEQALEDAERSLPQLDPVNYSADLRRRFGI